MVSTNEFAAKGAIPFFDELTPIKRGCKNVNGRVTFLESLLTYLNLQFSEWLSRLTKALQFNPIALRMAKILWTIIPKLSLLLLPI